MIKKIKGPSHMKVKSTVNYNNWTKNKRRKGAIKFRPTRFKTNSQNKERSA